MGLFRPPNVQKLKEQQDFKGLAKSLGSDDPAVRGDAARALTELANADAVPPIVDVASGQRDETVLASVGEALVGIGQPAAARLVAIVDSGPSDQSVVAIALLGRMGDQDGLPALRDLIAHSAGDTRADLTTRSLAALSLGNLGTPAAIDTVVTLLDDPTPPVRLAAAMALENHPDPRAADALRRLTNDRDPAVRDQAAKALAALGGSS
jgi:HEAT repeat protein